MKTQKAKKITLATVKSFIRKNQGKLFIKTQSSFSGYTDCVEQIAGAKFEPAVLTSDNIQHTIGISGAWFVGSSRDYFRPFEDSLYTGIEVVNSCGCFTIAIEKNQKEKPFISFYSNGNVIYFGTNDNRTGSEPLTEPFNTHIEKIIKSLGLENPEVEVLNRPLIDKGSIADIYNVKQSILEFLAVNRIKDKDKKNIIADIERIVYAAVQNAKQK
jgi:hypothetical protein